MVTVIPEGDNYEFLGWATPGFNKFSISKLSPLSYARTRSTLLMLTITGKKEHSCDQDNTRKSFPWTSFRLPAKKRYWQRTWTRWNNSVCTRLSRKIWLLCEFVCTSKTPVQEILEKGIELMIKELS